MTFREKTAWIAVLCTLAIWGYYFATVGGAVLAGTLDGNAVFWLFVWCIAATIVLMLGLAIAAARMGRHPFGAAPDERERAIDDRSNRVGLALIEWLGIGVVALNMAISGYAREAFPADPAGATAIIMANSFLFVLVLSATVREIIQVVSFRLMD